MEGERIVQCGTPQQIYSKPANDYVADFVAHMNPLGVLRACDVMEPVAASAPIRNVAPDEKIKNIINDLIEHDMPIGVEEQGNIIGQITPQGVLTKLLDPRQRS